jgi:hypothetical protein
VDLAMWKANIIPNIIPFAPLARLRVRQEIITTILIGFKLKTELTL